MLRQIFLIVCIAVAAAGCARDARQSAGGAARFAIAVTDTGFAPETIIVPAGKPITLVVTRNTDETCAKEIVFPDQGIRKALPLNKAVEITLPPSAKREIDYKCGMDMLYGKVIVR